MQILFISDETEIFKFLSGMQAEAMMPQGNIEISGMSEESVVTVICSGLSSLKLPGAGASTHYPATITRIDSGFQTETADMKWLSVKFIVRRMNARPDYDIERTTLND